MTPDPRPARRRWPKLLRPVLTIGVLAAAAVSVWRALGHDMDGVGAFLHRPDAAAWIAGAALFDLSGLVLGMVAWRGLLASLGHPLPLHPTVRIYGAAMLGKYLPGPFWSGLAIVHMGRGSGVPAGRMVAAYALNSVLVLLAAGVVGLFAAPEVLDQSTTLLALGVWLLAVFVYRPRLIIRMAELMAVVLRRPRSESAPGDGPLRLSLAFQVLSWLVGGIHLCLIIMALGGPVGPGALLLYVGGFALASAAGMLALLAPDGAGVREVVLTLALTPVLTTQQTITAVVVSRLACTAAEVGGSTLGLAATALQARRRPAAVIEPGDSLKVPETGSAAQRL